MSVETLWEMREQSQKLTDRVTQRFPRLSMSHVLAVPWLQKLIVPILHNANESTGHAAAHFGSIPAAALCPAEITDFWSKPHQAAQI